MVQIDYTRDGQPMAHAPNVAHCMIRSGALHPCDNNKVSLLIGGYKRFMVHLKPYDIKLTHGM